MVKGNENNAQHVIAVSWHGTTITAEAQHKFFDMIGPDEAKQHIQVLFEGYIESKFARKVLTGTANADMAGFVFALIDFITSVEHKPTKVKVPARHKN